jgi:hypothetical protein
MGSARPGVGRGLFLKTIGTKIGRTRISRQSRALCFFFLASISEAKTRVSFLMLGFDRERERGL